MFYNICKVLQHFYKWFICQAFSCPEKNIPNINDCRSKKNLPILIIFGTDIFDTSGHQIINHFITSFNVCFCTTWGKRNQRNMGWNEQKYVKKHPNIIDCDLKKN